MKYSLTDQSIIYDGRTLYRIQALRDIPRFGVKVGDLGGYVESEKNLSQDGDAWVYGDARVFGNARVYGNAWVYGNAGVSDYAWVYDNARVSGDALVSGNARVYGNAWVSGNAWVYGNAGVSGDALVSGNARVYGNAEVYGNAWVYGNARVYDNTKVSGNALIQSSISSTSEYLVFHLAGYSVTMTKDLIIAGCQAKTYKEWMNADLSVHGVLDQEEVKRTLKDVRKAFRSLNKHLFKRV